MPIDKALWYETFHHSAVPLLPCPHCKHGRLTLSDSDLRKISPDYNKRIKDHPDFEPDWNIERFVALLKCNNKECGEIVACSGDISVEDDFDDDVGHYQIGKLQPRNMFPAPPIISLPENTPPGVRRELSLAFEVFWADTGCSAAKIRTSVERLMDHFKVVKYFIAKDKKNPTKKGKYKPFDLAVRIDKFVSATKQVAHKDTLHALRVAGNLGVHQNSLTRSELLDVFAVYEEALAELIGKKSTEFAKLVKKIKSSKPKR